MTESLNRWMPHALSLLRIIAALIFFEHGAQKLLGFPPSPQAGPLPTLLVVQGCIELVGGILLIIGLFTRAVAFVLSGDMAVAYFMVHVPKSPFPTLSGGDAAILFCFVFFYLVFAGGGPVSVDALRGNVSTTPRQG
jgi:putative oxidoreductase